MKTLLLMSVLVVCSMVASFYVGCCTFGPKDCSPEIIEHKCVPPLAEGQVLCYMAHDVKVQDRWIKTWVPTGCKPGCVDADLAKVPGCK